MANLETRVVKTKKLDKELTLKVSHNEASARIFVEFSLESSKVLLQKTFQDNFLGRQDAEDFQGSIKSTNDLKRYFGIK